MQALQIEYTNLEQEYNQLNEKIDLMKRIKEKIVKNNEKLKADEVIINNEIIKAIFFLNSNKIKDQEEVIKTK
jgi:hypothetical protein